MTPDWLHVFMLLGGIIAGMSIQSLRVYRATVERLDNSNKAMARCLEAKIEASKQRVQFTPGNN